MTFTWDKAGLKKFEKQLQSNIDDASRQATKVAMRRSSKDAQISTYIREMKKSGVHLSRRDVERFF